MNGRRCMLGHMCAATKRSNSSSAVLACRFLVLAALQCTRIAAQSSGVGECISSAQEVIAAIDSASGEIELCIQLSASGYA